MGFRVLSKVEALNLRQEVVKNNFVKADKIVSKYNLDLDEGQKNVIKLDIVKIFNLISNYNLQEKEVLADVHQLIVNDAHELIGEYYKDLSKKSREFKAEIDELILEGVEKRNENQTKYPEVFSDSNTVYFSIDKIVPLSKQVIDAQNYINEFQDEKNLITLKESVISLENRAKQEKGVGYRLVYKNTEYKVNKFINSKVKIIDSLKKAFNSSSEEKKSEFLNAIQNLQYEEYHKQKKDFSGNIYKKFDDEFLYNIVKSFKLEEFENGLEELSSNMNQFSTAMKSLADKNDAIKYDDVNDDNVIDMIEFSVSPYKIATSSTYKNWESCMGPDKFERYYLTDSISEGEIVAYMINSKNPNKKISRTLLKPYKNIDTGNIIYKLAPFYGKQVSGLKKIIKTIADGNFHNKEKGFYDLNPKVYDDKLPSSISVFDDIFELLESGNVKYKSDENSVFIDQDFDLRKFGKLEFNNKAPLSYVNGKVILTKDNVNNLSFSRLPYNRDGIENISNLGFLDKYKTKDVLSKVYGNNWANKNVKDIEINSDLDFTNMHIKSLPNDFSRYFVNGKVNFKGNELYHLDIANLPSSKDGVSGISLGDVSEYSTLEVFAKVFGDEWCDSNIDFDGDKTVINSDVKLNGMKIIKLPHDFSQICINGVLDLSGNEIEDIDLSQLPKTTRGINSVKNLGDISKVNTSEFLEKLKGSNWAKININQKEIRSDLQLINIGITNLPDDLNQYRVNGVVDLRVNSFVETDINKLPTNIGGITGVKALGDLSAMNTKEFLSKVKGKKWVDSFYKEKEDGKVVINSDLKLDNYGISRLPDDFYNINFINGEYSLWGNNELIKRIGVDSIIDNANGAKGYFNFGDLSNYNVKTLASKMSGKNWVDSNLVEAKNSKTSSYLKSTPKFTQLGMTKLPHDLNKYEFINGLSLWGNKLSEIDVDKLPLSKETSFDRNVQLNMFVENVDDMEVKGLKKFTGNKNILGNRPEKDEFRLLQKMELER